MTRQEALNALTSPDRDKRLEAARTLALHALREDSDAIQAAIAIESVVWVRTALRHAIERISADEHPQVQSDQDIGDLVSLEAYRQIKTIATNAVTKQILHEIAPLVGTLELLAKGEIQNFSESRTKKQIDRLAQWLHALNRLSRAAVAPILQEFDLARTIREISETETTERAIKVEYSGSAPMVVVGDFTLIEIALANGLRNAIEAVEQFRPEDPPAVVVSWGETDRDIWIAVLDKGPGPPLAIERAFDIGSTSKVGHLGMGLATARQAVESMSGTVTLSPRLESGGARLEFRIPKTVSDR